MHFVNRFSVKIGKLKAAQSHTKICFKANLLNVCIKLYFIALTRHIYFLHLRVLGTLDVIYPIKFNKY